MMPNREVKLLFSSSVVSPKRGQSQEQQRVSKTFVGNHVGELLGVYFCVLPNSALPFLHPQPSPGPGPRPDLGWRRQFAAFAAIVSSSSEICAGYQIILFSATGSRKQVSKVPLLPPTFPCKNILFFHCAFDYN